MIVISFCKTIYFVTLACFSVILIYPHSLFSYFTIIILSVMTAVTFPLRPPRLAFAICGWRWQNDVHEIKYSVCVYRIAFAPAQKSYRITLLFIHENGCGGAISVTKRSCAALSLNWRVTYRIGVHTIRDSFSRRHENQIPDNASIHTRERLWRRDFCNGMKLRSADL